MKPCYHCHRNPARPRSNFCAECCHRPLFFPSAPASKATKAKAGLLYLAAGLTTTWLIYKTVTYVLTH